MAVLPIKPAACNCVLVKLPPEDGAPDCAASTVLIKTFCTASDPVDGFVIELFSIELAMFD